MSIPDTSFIPVKVGPISLFIQTNSSALLDHISEDELIAIVYALRERSERVPADYANFLGIVAGKLETLTNHPFDDEEEVN